jgi:cystinosin
MYSSSMRQQYAARHPLSPEPTVQLNDVAFGAHAVVLVVLTYSQFYSRLWGFQVPEVARASRPALGVAWGSALGVLSVMLIVIIRSGWTDQDALDWAWIDVVRLRCLALKLLRE